MANIGKRMSEKQIDVLKLIAANPGICYTIAQKTLDKGARGRRSIPRQIGSVLVQKGFAVRTKKQQINLSEDGIAFCRENGILIREKEEKQKKPVKKRAVTRIVEQEEESSADEIMDVVQQLQAQFSDVTPADYTQLEAAELELAKIEAREGNPIPYLRLQWPDVKIEDEEKILIYSRFWNRNENTDLLIDDFQMDILMAPFSPAITKLAIKGCTKPGKGWSIAIALNIYFDIWDDARIILVGPNTSQMENGLFAEIANWRRKMKNPGPGNILSRGVKDNDKHRMLIANPDTGEGLSGLHGPHTAYVFDESSAVPDDLYENALTQARIIIAISNPRVMSGWFYRLFETAVDKDKTQVTGSAKLVTVAGDDCLNVKMKCLRRPHAPKGGYETPDWIPAKEKKDYYEEAEYIPPEVYKYIEPAIPAQLEYEIYLQNLTSDDKRKVQWSAHGRFPSEDEEIQVILPSWIERHTAAWREGHEGIPIEAAGLDVAASRHGDCSVLAVGGSQGLIDLHNRQYADTMETVAWAIASMRDIYGIDLTDGSMPIAVDKDGLGKGVGDRLAEVGCWVIPIIGNSAASVQPERFGNARAENYGLLADRLNPEVTDEPWMLLPDSMLIEELCAPEKRYRSDGVKFTLTPKKKSSGSNFKGDSLIQKLGRSPDRADAVVYMYAAVRELESEAAPTLDRPLLVFGGSGVDITQERHPTERFNDPVTDAISGLFHSEDIADQAFDLSRGMGTYGSPWLSDGKASEQSSLFEKGTHFT